MSNSAPESYAEAIGRRQSSDDRIAPDRAAALAATLDRETVPVAGDLLPPGWHWIYFNPFVPRSQLGTDGHPKRGDFLPDVSLPRRMWAGGRLTYHRYLTVGESATRESEILNVVSKSGRAGELVFVTVRHRLSQNGTLCIEEEQDIVYREAAVAGSKAPDPIPAPESAKRSNPVTPDPVLLFRYSALTSNGHRIHYDRAYAQQEENYRDLVVHGPLTATLLQGMAEEEGRPLAGFEFRGMAPLFVDRPYSLQCGEIEDGVLPLWASGPESELAMQAKAVLID